MSGDKKESNSTLLALTSSALLLPAYQAANAAAPPEFTEVGLRYSNYEEDDTASSKTFGGSSERMEVDVAQFHLLAPVADDWSVALDVSWEDMSGASPWFVGESAEGDSKVVMSGASIEDTRTEVSVTTRYYYDRGSAGFNYSRSDEDDYESDAVAVDASYDSDDGMSTYSASLSASADEIEPTQGVTPTGTLKDEKDIRSAWVGVSRIVSKRAILRFGLSYTYRDGFLTDPYKLNDERPDRRNEWVIQGGYRQFLVTPNAALHVDYRYFNDDWGIDAHTVDIAWHQNVGGQTAIIPFLRYHTQDEADFFANSVDFSERYYADDYRLSAYGAVSLGLKLRHDIGNWRLNLAAERYQSNNEWGIYGGEESPALVDFWRTSIGLDYRFR
ncbi:MAG: DUF3570 domain-containing protein [Halioglobus sp.]|nr:DUF3570 domain-containing protein [Halioglobus sp.]MDG2327847.1 DUF3570 domain-containing protein [Halioglobus sp.]